MFSKAMAASSTQGSAGLVWLVGLGAIMSAISLYYYLLVLKQAFVREPAVAEPLKLHWAHQLALLVPALLLVGLGLYPTVLYSPVAKALGETLQWWLHTAG
jgi:NADH-quinone oxidoreductase subunit N